MANSTPLSKQTQAAAPGAPRPTRSPRWAQPRKSATCTPEFPAHAALAHHAASRPAQVEGNGGEARARDEILARYVGSLRALEPFSPDQEILAARGLEKLEVELWRLVLQTPGIRATLLQAAREDVDPDLGAKVKTLLLPMGARKLRITPADLTAAAAAAAAAPGSELEQLAADLRWADADKILIDAVMMRLEAATRGGSVRMLANRRDAPGEPTSAAQHDPSPPTTAVGRRHLGVRRAALQAIKEQQRKALQARNDFVRANLRLVIRVAQSFRGYGVPIVDSIQEGNLGLMKAVDRFDYRRGFRFSTYAHWWIRHCIQRSIANMDGQLRLPLHLREWRRRIEESRRQLRHTLGRDASSAEIAHELGSTADLVDERLRDAHRVCHSFDDDPMAGTESRATQEVLLDEPRRGIDDIVIEQDLHARLLGYLNVLKPMERGIIERRFGLLDSQDQTLDEVSKAYNLSRERVRQIQQQGITKLRRLCKYNRVSCS